VIIIIIKLFHMTTISPCIYPSFMISLKITHASTHSFEFHLPTASYTIMQCIHVHSIPFHPTPNHHTSREDNYLKTVCGKDREKGASWTLWKQLQTRGYHQIPQFFCSKFLNLYASEKKSKNGSSCAKLERIALHNVDSNPDLLNVHRDVNVTWKDENSKSKARKWREFLVVVTQLIFGMNERVLPHGKNKRQLPKDVQATLGPIN